MIIEKTLRCNRWKCVYAVKHAKENLLLCMHICTIGIYRFSYKMCIYSDELQGIFVALAIVALFKDH